jgi:hypothetical protein
VRDGTAWGRAIFHGKRGELRQRYREGQEDQLGALGLVVNMIVLWNTIYVEAALNQLRLEGHQVWEADVARLSPLIHDHINMLGRYSFAMPETVARGELRPSGNKQSPAEELPGRGLFEVSGSLANHSRDGSAVVIPERFLGPFEPFGAFLLADVACRPTIDSSPAPGPQLSGFRIEREKCFHMARSALMELIRGVDEPLNDFSHAASVCSARLILPSFRRHKPSRSPNLVTARHDPLAVIGG